MVHSNDNWWDKQTNGPNECTGDRAWVWVWVCAGRCGRAGHIGLAISLVSTVKEKVWYYDKRKWKGKKLSTQLANIDANGTPVSGGCCTW